LETATTEAILVVVVIVPDGFNEFQKHDYDHDDYNEHDRRFGD